MCAFCTVLTGAPHWTEAGSDAGRASEPESGRARYLHRLYRVALINRVLACYGCKAEDWANNQYVVRGQSGHTALVEQLPQIWQTVEGIAGRPADPLDPALLDALRAQAPVAPAQAADRRSAAVSE